MLGLVLHSGLVVKCVHTVSHSCVYNQAGFNGVCLGSFRLLVLNGIKFSAQCMSRNQEYLTKNAH